MNATLRKPSSKPKPVVRVKAAGQRQPSSRDVPDALTLYRSTIDGVIKQLSSGFVDSIKGAIRSHDKIAASGFMAWRIALKNPSVRKAMAAALKERRYDVIDSRRFAAWLMDHCPDIDDQYVRRFRALLQSTFERLDSMMQSGEWKLSSLPALPQIESKIAELGGVPELHRNWVKQRSASVRGADTDWKAHGFDSEDDMKEFQARQRESRQRVCDANMLKEFTAEAVELGERVKGCPGAGMGIYIETAGGIVVKLPPEQTRLIISYLRRSRSEKL